MEDNKRKKTKRDKLNIDEKKQLRKYGKNEKKAIRDNLNNEKKEHIKAEDSKGKKQSVTTLIIQLRKYGKKEKWTSVYKL